MLQQLNLMNKNNNIKHVSNKYKESDYRWENFKHFPAINQQWFNSIYLYNKNDLKTYIVKEKTLNNYIKSFFNLTFIIRKKIKSKKRRIRLKRLSTNKIIVAKAYLKHTNNKIIILLFTYNRQKFLILKKIIQIYKILKKRNRRKKIKFYLKKKIYRLLKHNKAYKIKLLKLRILFNKLKNKLNTKANKERTLLIKTIKSKKINIFRSYLNKYSKLFNLQNLIFSYNKLLLLNSYKFKNFFLLNLKRIISKLFNNKKIEFRIFNMKQLFLNSDILMEAIAIKLKNRKNKIRKIFFKAFKILKVPLRKRFFWLRYKLKAKSVLQYNINEFLSHNLFNFYKQKVKSPQLRKIVLNSIKNKHICGVRIEGKGRLTPRLTAFRSISKTNYRGTIKNIYSSYAGLSSVILKGHYKSTIQYTIVNSKTRNGSFGVRGWIGSF